MFCKILMQNSGLVHLVFHKFTQLVEFGVSFILGHAFCIDWQFSVALVYFKSISQTPAAVCGSHG